MRDIILAKLADIAAKKMCPAFTPASRAAASHPKRDPIMTNNLVFPVTIYYEDTDITGLVYHPNYFKYFERARSHFFDAQELRRLQMEEGIGVAVYRADVVFKRGASLGDRLEIHSQPALDGHYRVVVQHRVFRADDPQVLVEATVELVCVASDKLVKIPPLIRDKVLALAGA
jgi:YbgC/YbaW family acyl-CoA thioester hydrolase